MTNVTTADQWADALDAEMAARDISAGDLISHGYNDGEICGVKLDPTAVEANDEKGVVVSLDTGWVVAYSSHTGFWVAR